MPIKKSIGSISVDIKTLKVSETFRVFIISMKICLDRGGGCGGISGGGPGGTRQGRALWAEKLYDFA
jgi:hypothetical protein